MQDQDSTNNTKRSKSNACANKLFSYRRTNKNLPCGSHLRLQNRRKQKPWSMSLRVCLVALRHARIGIKMAWRMSGHSALRSIPTERKTKRFGTKFSIFLLLYLFSTSHHAKPPTCNNGTEARTREWTASTRITRNDAFRAQPATANYLAQAPCSPQFGTRVATEHRVRIKKKGEIK